jgi:CRP-like cAMP-binding protein
MLETVRSTPTRATRIDEPLRRALGACTALEMLPAAALDELARRASARRVARRGVLFTRGDAASSVFVVGTGRVRLVRGTGRGRELTLDYAGPGDLVGGDALFADRFDHEARATERVEAIEVPARSLRRAAAEAPKVGLALAEASERRRRAAERRIEDLLTCTVEERVARFVGEMARRFGASDPRGTAIAHKLTHLEIASYVGSTRETVTLVLGDLRRRGLVVMDTRRIIVPDVRALDPVQ